MSPPAVVTCLVSGDYWHGAGTLLNSLSAHDFVGRFVVAHTDAVPSWWGARLAAASSALNGRIAVATEQVKLWHGFGAHKARLLADVAAAHPGVDVFLFDADIVVAASWRFYTAWVKEGVAMCRDGVFDFLPLDAVRRHQWRRLCAATGLRVHRELTTYCNSGFVAMQWEHRAFATDWIRTLEAMAQQGVPVDRIKQGHPLDAYHIPDQDGFNIACMITDVPLASMPPGAMGLGHGDALMHHLYDQPKPWRRRHLSRLLRYGLAPSAGDVNFFRMAGGPLRLQSGAARQLAQIDLLLARMLGRFLRAR